MIRQAPMFVLVALLTRVLPALADDAGGLPPPLTPTDLLTAFHIRHLYEYSCPQSLHCEVRCNGADGQDKFHYMDVRRLEIAPGKEHWLLAAAHVDAVGKGHESSAILPVPVSCILDDLALDRISQFSDGQLTRPPGKEGVIFDVEPQAP